MACSNGGPGLVISFGRRGGYLPINLWSAVVRLPYFVILSAPFDNRPAVIPGIRRASRPSPNNQHLQLVVSVHAIYKVSDLSFPVIPSCISLGLMIITRAQYNYEVYIVCNDLVRNGVAVCGSTTGIVRGVK